MTSNNKPPFVSVVIALKDEKGYIEKVLESLLKQTYPVENYEILIYDGQSTDGTREYLLQMAKKHPQIKVYDNPKIVAAAGWNEGFRQAKGKYVVMMGGHTFVASDFIEKNVELLENSQAPCAGGSVTAIGQDTKSQAIALAFNHPFGVGDARYRYAKKQCYVETINYGMYRKEVVDVIGPINEEIKRGEDWEYNYRIVRKFGKMIYSPAVKSYYFARSNFRKLWKRQYDAGKYKLEILRKYPGSILFRHIVPFVFAFLVIILPVLTVLGLPSIYLIAFWAIYLLTNVIFSAWISIKKGLRNFFFLIWAFFVMQFAYGFGFMVGLGNFVLNFLSGKHNLEKNSVK